MLSMLSLPDSDMGFTRAWYRSIASIVSVKAVTRSVTIETVLVKINLQRNAAITLERIGIFVVKIENKIAVKSRVVMSATATLTRR